MILKRLAWLVALTAIAFPYSAFAKPAPKPNYIYSENGVYYYEAAITRQQSEAGQVAGDAVGYKYHGKNARNEYVLVQVSGSGTIVAFIYCKNPCRVIRTGSGERFVNNSKLLVSSAFTDAIRGMLQNTNPDVRKPRPKTTVSVPSRPPIDTNGKALGITKTATGMVIRSAVNAAVYATADGVVEFAGQLEGYSNAIRLGHGNEIQTVYGNLGRIAVLPKATVSKGQVIGFVGDPADAGSPELIYEVRIAGVSVDPMSFMSMDGADGWALVQPKESLGTKE